MKQKNFLILIACSFGLTLLGCGGSGFQTAPVTGVVKLDDQPVSGVVVNFTPQPTDTETVVGPFSFGRTDDEGKFTLQLRRNAGPGAVVGEHKISIQSPEYDPAEIAEYESLIQEKKRNNQDSSAEEAKLARMKAAKTSIPPKYSDDSPLSVTVPAEGLQDYVISIKSTD
ncbi:MAG: hypothetical protein AAF939_20875 [Planctomycetota bacterium]